LGVENEVVERFLGKALQPGRVEGNRQYQGSGLLLGERNGKIATPIGLARPYESPLL
jgi:hypothetical protein